MRDRISQTTLFGDERSIIKIPTTRYQGSKAKLVHWIWESIRRFNFETVLDAFGGTGIVAYYLKNMGKEVHYNDYLKFNYYVGLSLIENNDIVISDEKIKLIMNKNTNREYKNFIYETFRDIYYTNEENIWLDIVVQNINSLSNIYEKALLFNALFQSALVKRPFNLFHRKNLYIRKANVSRSFGNKTTWDTPFERHFINFIYEINKLVFSNNRSNKSFNLDVFELPEDYDLVYLDPPYTSQKGITVDYLDFYHFLEGIVNYEIWDTIIDYRTKHRRLKRIYNPWNNPKKIKSIFREVIEKFKNSIICISYRSDGIPSIEEIKGFVKDYKKNVDVFYFDNYRYVLSNDNTQEVLITGW